MEAHFFSKKVFTLTQVKKSFFFPSIKKECKFNDIYYIIRYKGMENLVLPLYFINFARDILKQRKETD